MTQKLSVPEHRNTAQRDIESRQSDNQGERVDYRRLAWVAPLTAVAASISTAAVGFVEGVLGLLPQDIALFQPGSIAIGTCVQVVAAIVVFLLNFAELRLVERQKSKVERQPRIYLSTLVFQTFVFYVYILQTLNKRSQARNA